MPTQKIKEFLNENGIKFVTITHSPAYTAQEIAAMAHIPGKEMAKTVLVKIDGKMVMTVLPASDKVDLEALKEATKAESVRLAQEQEFINKFPGCDVGAMPPFGNLYNIEVIVAENLSEDEEIAFNAGTHTELIKMSYKDFERLVKPMKLQFSMKSKV